jgi:hypothetical protein
MSKISELGFPALYRTLVAKPGQMQLFSARAQPETSNLPPPADPPDAPQMSEWISRKQFWKEQRDDHALTLDRSGWGGSWDAECEALWQNDPEAWFAKYEPRHTDVYGTYEDRLAWLNGLSSTISTT